MKKYICIGLLTFLLLGCSRREATEIPSTALPETVPPSQTQQTEFTDPQEEPDMPIPSTSLLEPRDSDLVRVRDYIPDVQEELKYATSDNFTGTVIYNFQDIYLRYGTVKKLMAVQEELHSLGLGLKIWDGFRPVSAQFKLWEICPDDTYVANPNVGYSNHSRGFAVDLTLVDASGQELEMPTQFDDFSGRANRDYSEIPEPARSNALLLEGIMEKHGFQGYSGEWWHFNDITRYEVEHIFDPGVISCWQVTGSGALLLDQPRPDAAHLANIPSGDAVTVLGFSGNYALANWNGIRGYLPAAELKPVS